MTVQKLNIARELIKRVVLPTLDENRNLRSSEIEALDFIRNSIGDANYEKLCVEIMSDNTIMYK